MKAEYLHPYCIDTISTHPLNLSRNQTQKEEPKSFHFQHKDNDKTKTLKSKTWTQQQLGSLSRRELKHSKDWAVHVWEIRRQLASTDHHWYWLRFHWHSRCARGAENNTACGHLKNLTSSLKNSCDLHSRWPAQQKSASGLPQQWQQWPD